MKRVFSTFYIEKLKFSLNVSSHPQSTTYLLLPVVPNVYCISSSNSSCQPLLSIALCSCRPPFAVAIRYFQLDSHNNCGSSNLFAKFILECNQFNSSVLSIIHLS